MIRIQQHPLEPFVEPNSWICYRWIGSDLGKFFPNEKEKEKSYKLHDYIRKYVDDSLGVTHLETPNKLRKLVKKHRTFSTDLSSSDNQILEIQRNRKKTAEDRLTTTLVSVLKN